MNEEYVTVFSNTSQLQFPNNSTSKFSVLLPRNLHLQGEWEVGLVECSHPPIIGTVEGDNEQDVIIFPYIVSEHTFSYELSHMVQFILSNSKRPNLYGKRYFYEFLNIENLNDFAVNESMKKHKITVEGEKHLFKLSPYIIPFQYRASMEEKDYIQFASHKPYTMKQVLWNILNTYYNIFRKADSDPRVLEKYGIIKTKTVPEMLYTYAATFVNTVRQYISSFESKESHHLLIYLDCVAPSIVGNSLSRLLYITTRKSEVSNDLISVQNIKYMPVAKSFISDLSFLFVSEFGTQIMFESGYKPTFIQLHFRKVR